MYKIRIVNYFHCTCMQRNGMPISKCDFTFEELGLNRRNHWKQSRSLCKAMLLCDLSVFLMCNYKIIRLLQKTHLEMCKINPSSIYLLVKF